MSKFVITRGQSALIGGIIGIVSFAIFDDPGGAIISAFVVASLLSLLSHIFAATSRGDRS